MYSNMASVKLTCTKDIAGPVLVQVSKQVCNTMHLDVQYKFNYISKAAVGEGNLFTFFSKYCRGQVVFKWCFHFYRDWYCRDNWDSRFDYAKTQGVCSPAHHSVLKS